MFRTLLPPGARDTQGIGLAWSDAQRVTHELKGFVAVEAARGGAHRRVRLAGTRKPVLRPSRTDPRKVAQMNFDPLRLHLLTQTATRCGIVLAYEATSGFPWEP